MASPFLIRIAMALLALAGSTAAGFADAAPAEAPAPSTGAAAVPAASQSRAADVRAEMISLGWQPVGALPECALEQPRIEAREAARLAMVQPRDLPPPRLTCGERGVALPVLKDPALLQRIEGSPAMATWQLRAQGEIRGNASVVSLDFPPFEEPRPQAGALDPRLAAFGMPMTVMPRPVMDPGSRVRGSKYNKVPEPPPAPIQPDLRATPAADGLSADALAASLDGTTWVALALGGDQARTDFELDLEKIFAGERRLLVAPRSRQVQASSVLLAVDPATGSVTSLGRPAPPEAGQWFRVTDARERGGVLEALVVADQITHDGLGSPWGLLAVLQGGAWTFPERYFTPSAVNAAPRLLFDDARPDVVVLDARELRATRPLRSPPAAPAP